MLVRPLLDDKNGDNASGSKASTEYADEEGRPNCIELNSLINLRKFQVESYYNCGYTLDGRGDKGEIVDAPGAPQYA